MARRRGTTSSGGRGWREEEQEGGGAWRGKTLLLLDEEDQVTPRFDLIKFLIWKRGNVSDSIRAAADRRQLPHPE